MKEVNIIGTGFSGLTLAYYLNKAKPDLIINIFEQKDKCSGLVSSVYEKNTIFELGASSLYLTKTLEQLCYDLDLKFIAPKNRNNKYILVNNSIKTPVQILKPMDWLFLPRTLYLLKNLPPDTKVNALEWSKHYFGVNIAENIISPIIQGIFSCSAGDLSSTALINYIKTLRNLPKPATRSRLINFKKGLNELLATIYNHLKQKDNIRFNFNQKGKLEKDKVNYVCTSLKSAQEILKDQTLQWLKDLNQCQTLPLHTYNILSDNTLKINGFGVLFPQKEKGILGVINKSYMFPQHVNDIKTHLETWITSKNIETKELLSFRSKHLNSLTDASIIKKAHKEWPHALPLYNEALINFQKNYHSIENKQIKLHGNYVNSIGLASILEQSKFLGETHQ